MQSERALVPIPGIRCGAASPDRMVIRKRQRNCSGRPTNESALGVAARVTRAAHLDIPTLQEAAPVGPDREIDR